MVDVSSVSMYRFAFRPMWILSHVLVAALIVSMVNLGFWQLRRLDTRKATNALVSENAGGKPVLFETFLDNLGSSSIDEQRYRSVEIQGTFDPSGEVAVRNRTLEGAPGRWIATPLRPADGGPAVLVMRGFVPQAVNDTTAPFESVAPPPGVVRIAGWIQPTQTRGAIGPTDPPTGRLDELARLDVGRVAEQFGDLQPFWVQQYAQDPPQPDGRPTPVVLPLADEGNHFSYAMQWFIFTLIAVIGYPIVLRREARRRRAEALEDAALADAPSTSNSDTHAEGETVPDEAGAAADDQHTDEPGLGRPSAAPTTGAPV